MTHNLRYVIMIMFK